MFCKFKCNKLVNVYFVFYSDLNDNFLERWFVYNN